jgi:succinyl-CoA synthetase beta subunit
VEELRERSVTFFASPERALQALAIVTEWAGARANLQLAPAKAVCGLPLSEGVIPEYKSKEVLKYAGVPVLPGALARTVEEAITIGNRIGFPVVLKAQSAHLPHKSDAGGVVLNVINDAGLAAGWRRIEDDIAHAAPRLVLDGVLVEKMGHPGVELIVSARNDVDWGPVLMIGLGGVLAEALQDVRLLAPGLSVNLIEQEMLKLKGSALLRGFRGAQAVDLRAAAEIVSTLGTLMLATESLVEIEINPLVVYPAGHGAAALDALIVTKSGVVPNRGETHPR